jgi:hypothetical protein
MNLRTVKVEKVIIIETLEGDPCHIVKSVYDLDGNRLCSDQARTEWPHCPNGDLETCPINRDAIKLHEYLVKRPGYKNDLGSTVEMNALEYIKYLERTVR